MQHDRTNQFAAVLGSAARRFASRSRGLGAALLVLLAFVAACSGPLDAQDELESAAVLVRSASVATAGQAETGASLQGATVTGEVEIFVDEAGWMREVWYFLDEAREPLAIQSEAPFALMLDTTRLSDGEHVLRVEPHMPNGRIRSVTEIAFRVDNDGERGEQDDGPENSAPTLDVGEDQTVQLGDGAHLAASVTDDGLPHGRVSVEWTRVEGPGTITFSAPDEMATRADFSDAGEYAIRATASDGELRAIDTLHVVVTSPPSDPEPGPGDDEGDEQEEGGDGDPADGEGGSGEGDDGDDDSADGDGNNEEEDAGNDSEDGEGGDEGDGSEPTPAPTFDPASIVWYGDTETGDISQWSESVDGLNIGCGGPQNSGGGVAYGSSDVSRSGDYSVALDIRDVDGDQGTRMFRGRCESRLHPEGLYYSVWFYLPTHFETLDGWWNIFQFKSKPFGYDGGSDPMWVIDALDQGDGTMRLRLRDKISGNSVYHGSAPIAFPTGEWVHLEAFFKGGSDDDGVIRIWQNGTKLWDMTDVDTIREGGDIRWAVNNYTSRIRPDPAIIYIDDAVISTERVGPDVEVWKLR